MSGNIIQYPINVDGSLNSAILDITHEGSSVNKDRQEAAHAHQIIIHPNGKDIYVCDLGLDQVKAYLMIRGKLTPNPAKDISIRPGGGPRHMVFDQEGKYAYLMNELTGAVSVLEPEDGVFREKKQYSALPPNFNDQASGSAIRIHSNGRFLYTADRSINAITIFAINGSELQLIDTIKTKGDEIREFNITPDGEWLLACHQNSHDLISYRIKEDGKLLELNRTKNIESPVCMIFPK